MPKGKYGPTWKKKLKGLGTVPFNMMPSMSSSVKYPVVAPGVSVIPSAQVYSSWPDTNSWYRPGERSAAVAYGLGQEPQAKDAWRPAFFVSPSGRDPRWVLDPSTGGVIDVGRRSGLGDFVTEEQWRNIPKATTEGGITEAFKATTSKIFSTGGGIIGGVWDAIPTVVKVVGIGALAVWAWSKVVGPIGPAFRAAAGASRAARATPEPVFEPIEAEPVKTSRRKKVTS
ncbi:MAG: hypothetical protein UY96_C0010G0006 [Parcubacteria group bacterium GW2011_GWB1_56_8]|nr:MAG: hypothetical protein UY96_C0010G0006 [Parcubacteria group bacterium GW2011_GWB1_56_8]